MIDLFNDGVTIDPNLASLDQNLGDGTTHGKIERAVLDLLQAPKAEIRARKRRTSRPTS